MTGKCSPPDSCPFNSVHILAGEGIGEELWVWNNGGWAKHPNARFVTPPTQMGILGWKYVGAISKEPTDIKGFSPDYLYEQETLHGGRND